MRGTLNTWSPWLTERGVKEAVPPDKFLPIQPPPPPYSYTTSFPPPLLFLFSLPAQFLSPLIGWRGETKLNVGVYNQTLPNAAPVDGEWGRCVSLPHGQTCPLSSVHSCCIVGCCCPKGSGSLVIGQF